MNGIFPVVFKFITHLKYHTNYRNKLSIITSIDYLYTILCKLNEIHEHFTRHGSFEKDVEKIKQLDIINYKKIDPKLYQLIFAKKTEDDTRRSTLAVTDNFLGKLMIKSTTTILSEKKDLLKVFSKLDLSEILISMIDSVSTFINSIYKNDWCKNYLHSHGFINCLTNESYFENLTKQQYHESQFSMKYNETDTSTENAKHTKVKFSSWKYLIDGYVNMKREYASSRSSQGIYQSIVSGKLNTMGYIKTMIRAMFDDSDIIADEYA